MNDLMAMLLSEERSTEERLRALDEMREFLTAEAVLDLASRARVEKSVAVRRAMLATVLAARPNPALREHILYFATVEPEADLRLMAIGRIDDEDILAETLSFDLDERVQAACIFGFTRITSRATVDAILTFATRSPVALRVLLIALAAKLDLEDAQKLLSVFLNPWERPEIRRRAIAALAEFPRLTHVAARALVAAAATEPAAIDVLTRMKDAAPSVLMELLARFPEEVAAFRHRLDSCAPAIVQVFKTTRSTSLKLTVLRLLDSPELWREALRDASPWVRQAAIPHAADDLGEALEREPVASLRGAMIEALAKSGRFDERAVLAACERGRDPRMALLLPRITITDGNRATLLRAYRRMMLDPFIDPKARAAVTDRLRSFAYRDEPELVECLKALLERETQIERVEEYHEQLRKLEPHLPSLAPLLLKLFFRHLHHYPRDPLHGWVRDFRDLAPRVPEVRRQIAYIAQVADADWILDAAGDTGRRTLILEKMKSGSLEEQASFLERAWQERALRKSDLVSLVQRVLALPDRRDDLAARVLKIVAAAKVATPEVQDACLLHLARWPHSMMAYEVAKFLKEHGDRDRIIAAFTQENYDRYCRLSGDAHDVEKPPRTWSEWDSAWRLTYRGWPIADVWAALDPLPLREALSRPVDPRVPPLRSIHYVVLTLLRSRDWSRYCKRTAKEIAEELRALGSLLGAPAELRDRAACLFRQEWTKYREAKGRPTAALAAFAAEAYVELCGLSLEREGPERWPKAIEGLDVSHLRSIWPHGEESWRELARERFDRASKAEEAAARELAESAGVAALRRLLTEFAHTEFVRSRRSWLKDAAWKLIHSDANPVAAREVLSMACGGEEALVKGLAHWLAYYATPEAVAPYVRFVSANASGWPPAAGLLAAVRAREEVMDETNRALVERALKLRS